jgi:DNA-binding IclR family transcriptional regulator
MIIETFEGQRRRMTVSEISRRSGVPKSTVHRLAAELVQHGYLERSDNVYQLGTRLFWLGQRVPEYEDLRQAALPDMVSLYQSAGQPVYLGVLGLGEVVYVEKLLGTRGIRSPRPVNARAPIHATASGKLMLAYSPLSAPLPGPGPLRRYTVRTVIEPATLRRELADIRAAGFAVSREEFVPGAAAVAVPLLSDGRFLGALAISPALADLKVDRMVPLLRSAANRIIQHYEAGSAQPHLAARR